MLKLTLLQLNNRSITSMSTNLLIKNELRVM